MISHDAVGKKRKHSSPGRKFRRTVTGQVAGLNLAPDAVSQYKSCAGFGYTPDKWAAPFPWQPVETEDDDKPLALITSAVVNQCVISAALPHH